MENITTLFNIAYILGTVRAQSIRTALEVLDYLHEEEKLDYLKSEYTKLRNFPYNSSFPDTNYTNYALILNKLQIRFYARLTAYLSTISQLEDNLNVIFDILYKENKNNLNIEEKATLKNERRKRKEEIKEYKRWRDKVFAHLETIGSKNLQEDAVIQYGGTRIDISNEECLSLKSSEYFPPLDMVTQHKTLLEHYDNWEKMFSWWEGGEINFQPPREIYKHEYGQVYRDRYICPVEVNSNFRVAVNDIDGEWRWLRPNYPDIDKALASGRQWIDENAETE